MREFIKIQISEGLKTRLKEIADEINVVNKQRNTSQEDLESDNKLQRLLLEKAKIETELKSHA
jgi:hypothetical protein